MSQFYRSSNFNYSHIHQQPQLVHNGNFRTMNKTFGPETPQIQRVFSPKNTHQNIYPPPQSNKAYESPVASHYVRPPSSLNNTLLLEKEETNKNQMIKETFLQATKDFMAEISKSIGQIARAQVEAIISQKQANSNMNIKFNKFQPERETRSSTEKIGYTRGFSMQDSNKDTKINAERIQLKDPNACSLRSNSLNQPQNTWISNLQTEAVKIQLNQLIKQIRGFGENKKQSRSIWLDIDLERIPESTKNERIHELKKRVFKIIENVLSVSFNMHYKDGVEFEKVKAYCCQNFIINFCKLAKMSRMSAKDMKIIEEQLQQEVLPYLNLTYPRSEQKLSNKELKSKISEKDIFNQNRFDIVYNSKVKLSVKQSQINSEVMKILNYVIKLPDEKAPLNMNEMVLQQQTKQKTLYEHFQRDMESIFTKVYKKQITDKLYKYKSNPKQQEALRQRMSDKKYLATQQFMRLLDEEILSPKLGPHKTQSRYDLGRMSSDNFRLVQSASKFSGGREDKQQKTSREQQKERQQQEQEYKEKVQSYTKFKIGRKISPNVEPYTDEEIQQGVLFMKDSSVARVLTKWVQAIQDQIKDPVKSLYLRDEPFRLHNSEETYLLSTEEKIKELYQLYRRSSKVIEQKSEDLKRNARQIFLNAIKSAEHEDKFKSYRQSTSENDALVGHICTVLLKSRQNHVQSYLNMLLGEIKYIEQEYQWKIEDKKIDLTSGPSLITMKLGDLMRCQITSKPKQIIALYQYIDLLCKLDPQKFQLVRVKDRSSTPNKDILINVFYHQKIMVEIQLAIKNDSAFISCSDRFSHFIYELIRAFLGPTNEMCNIWSQYSPKSQFFIHKFEELNIKGSQYKQLESDCKHQFEDEYKDLKLPFRCSNCGVFYYNSSTSRKKCADCNLYECCVCTIRSNEVKFIQKEFPDYEIKKERKIGDIFYVLDILNNSRHIKAMLKLEINGKLEAFSMKIEWNEQKYGLKPVISNIKSEYEISKRKKNYLKRTLFEQSHIILQKKKKSRREEENKSIDEVIKQILNVYYLPRRAKVIIKKSQSFMKLTLITNPQIKPAIKGEIITNIINNNRDFLVLIQKLNLNENGLSSLSIAGKLPNARNIVLNHNQIVSLNLGGLKKLITLELSHNRISQLSQLENLADCINLKRLLLDCNEIEKIDDLPKGLILLESLSLSKNKIRAVNSIKHFKNLRSLNLNENQLIKLDGIEQLTMLEDLRIKKNKKLEPQCIKLLKQLKKLKKLDMSSANLRKALLQSTNLLKDSVQFVSFNQSSISSYEPLLAIKSLTELEQLDASSNSLTFIPRIPELSKLKELNLSKNLLQDTKNLENFTNLKWLCLRQNHISEIKRLDYLKNLFWLDLSRNQLSSKELFTISLLKNLHQIELSNNKLTTLEGIGNLPKLYELSARANKLNSLKGIEKLTSLEHLDIRNNPQISELTGIEHLKMLFELKLSGNKIKNINSIKDLQNLKILQMNNCGFHDIKMIPKLKNLQELYLNNNQIEKLDGITNFNSLKKLQIFQNSNLSIKEHDLEGLGNMAYIAFSLTQKIEIEFVGNTESLQIIRIHKLKEPTTNQNNHLIALSLLGYNIQFFEVEEESEKDEEDASYYGNESIKF